MDISLIQLAVELRHSIGCFGENATSNWWASSFFSDSGTAFLEPVLPKTSFVAKMQGIKEAASLVHDTHIGVGKVYHLFRLPENWELEIFNLINQKESLIVDLDANKDDLLNKLSVYGIVDRKEGPARIGNLSILNQRKTWEQIAKLYYTAFINNYKTFPYVTNDND